MLTGKAKDIRNSSRGLILQEIQGLFRGHTREGHCLPI